MTDYCFTSVQFFLRLTFIIIVTNFVHLFQQTTVTWFIWQCPLPNIEYFLEYGIVYRMNFSSSRLISQNVLIIVQVVYFCFSVACLVPGQINLLASFHQDMLKSSPDLFISVSHQCSWNMLATLIFPTFFITLSCITLSFGKPLQITVAAKVHEALLKW